jgi:hypothetical protein
MKVVYFKEETTPKVMVRVICRNPKKVEKNFRGILVITTQLSSYPLKLAFVNLQIPTTTTLSLQTNSVTFALSSPNSSQKDSKISNLYLFIYSKKDQMRKNKELQDSRDHMMRQTNINRSMTQAC